MIKRTPSRNNRSKGIKLKHVLQIMLLLGVCFWLIYQIKHSHDKKKEFDENDAKESVRMQNADQIPKLGRKDLQPLKDDISQTEQQDEKEEDENNLDDEGNVHEHDEQEEEASKHETGENLDKQELKERDEEDEEEEESKHGAEELEEEENKSEESEDDGRGGDEEIEENDQEKPEVDIDHEDLMDEDKEREKEEGDEKENENGEDEEKDSSVENKSTHEAREEHYMADDASSAVAHDAQTTNTESVISSAENSNENSEMSILKQENKPKYTEESSTNQSDSAKIAADEFTNQSDSGKITADELKSGNVSNATGKESENTILSNSVNNSNVNTTATANSDGHLEVSGNHSVVNTEAANNSTGDSIYTPGSSELNKTLKLSESENSQNTTVAVTANDGVNNRKTEEIEKSLGNREENLPSTNSTVSMGTGNAGESYDSGADQSDKTINHVASNETHNKVNIDSSMDEKSNVHSEIAAANVTKNSSDDKENNDPGKDEKSMDDTQIVSTNRTSDSSSENGGASDLVEQDAIDASDSHIHKDVTEVRTDLETLPNDETNIFDEHALSDIRNEGNIIDETAAE